MTCWSPFTIHQLFTNNREASDAATCAATCSWRTRLEGNIQPQPQFRQGHYLGQDEGNLSKAKEHYWRIRFGKNNVKYSKHIRHSCWKKTYTYIRMYVCMYVYIYIYFTYIHLYMYIYIYTYTCTCIYIYIPIHVHM